MYSQLTKYSLKFYILLFYYCLLALSTQAQKMEFGPLGGINLAKTNHVPTDGISPARAGFYLGLFAEKKLWGKWAIQPELLYSLQGKKISGQLLSGAPFRGKSNLGYLNIPLLAKFYLLERLHLIAGPQVGILLSAKNQLTILGNQTQENVMSTFKPFDFSVTGGVAYEFTPGVALHLRYNVGLTNISKEEEERKHRVLQFGASFKF